MGLMISKNGKIKDFSLPSQRHIRSTDEQNVQFEDVLKKSPNKNFKEGQNENNKDHSKEKEREQERRRTSGIKSYIKQEHHTNYQRKHILARDVGSSPIISISPIETVGRALMMMEKYRVHHLLILDKEKQLKGIVSDRDLLNKRSNDNVMEHAKTEVIITKETTEIKVLAKIMLEKGISALPYIDQNEVVVGIITKTDILDYLVHSLPFETYI